jgi:hypothetical protein
VPTWSLYMYLLPPSHSIPDHTSEVLIQPLLSLCPSSFPEEGGRTIDMAVLSCLCPCLGRGNDGQCYSTDCGGDSKGTSMHSHPRHGLGCTVQISQRGLIDCQDTGLDRMLTRVPDTIPCMWAWIKGTAALPERTAKRVRSDREEAACLPPWTDVDTTDIHRDTRMRVCHTHTLEDRHCQDRG